MDRIYADESSARLLRLALLKSPAMMKAASGCLLLYPLSSLWSLDRAKLVSACWWNVDRSNDDYDENSRGR